MNPEIKQAISDFFEAVAKLKQLGVFRSDKYLGDLGEYISQYFFNVELCESGRQPGHDGIDADGFVQVKYHGSTTRTNVDLGNPDSYQNILVVLGPESLLRNKNYSQDFLVYRMSENDVRSYRNSNNTYSCGKEPFNRDPDKYMNLNA